MDLADWLWLEPYHMDVFHGTYPFAGHPERPAANLASGGHFQSLGRRAFAIAGRAGPLARRQLDLAQAVAYEAE